MPVSDRVPVPKVQSLDLNIIVPAADFAALTVDSGHSLSDTHCITVGTVFCIGRTHGVTVAQKWSQRLFAERQVRCSGKHINLLCVPVTDL